MLFLLVKVLDWYDFSFFGLQFCIRLLLCWCEIQLSEAQTIQKKENQ